VGKAIRDGVIEGRIIHEKGWMECGAQKNGYGPEVSEVFGRRIAFCLDLHNQSVKVCGQLKCTIDLPLNIEICRQCDTLSMHTEKSLLLLKVHEKERRSWPRRFKMETWTKKTLDLISDVSHPSST